MDRPQTTGATAGTPPLEDRSLGELVATATRDLSQLVHQEVELAKTEIKQDVAAASKGAGLFGGAGIAVLFALLFLSIAAAYGISWLGLPLGWAFFTVGLLYLIAAGVLALTGKKKVQEMTPPAERTVETVKDDVAMAKSVGKTP
jgi:hypothetical protein